MKLIIRQHYNGEQKRDSGVSDTMKKDHFIPLFLMLFVIACGQRSNEQLPQESHVSERPSTVSDTVKIAISSVDDIQEAYVDISRIIESQSLDSTSFKYDCNGEKRGTVHYLHQQRKSEAGGTPL